ncbi:MAG: GDSL-type esterase/lipase family protein, partial [Bacteroidota bacterium]
MSFLKLFNVPVLALFFLISPACKATSQAGNIMVDPGAPDPTRFAKGIERINKIEFDASRPRIVFTGSSSIRFWQDLPERYFDHQVINTGFGGSQMSDLLYYLEATVLRFSPAQVFLYEGDNDVSAQRPTAAIVENTQKVVRGIHEKFPACEIVLISAKPSIARWNLKPKYDVLNAEFKKYAQSTKNVEYANVWDIMLQPNGEVKQDIFIQDGLHMNKKGYDLWDEILGPMVGVSDDWELLFNGDNFDNFEQLNGDATYKIEDGQMIGISKLKTPNSFMATKKKYGDFILEFEVLVENG